MLWRNRSSVINRRVCACPEPLIEKLVIQVVKRLWNTYWTGRLSALRQCGNLLLPTTSNCSLHESSVFAANKTDVHLAHFPSMACTWNIILVWQHLPKHCYPTSSALKIFDGARSDLGPFRSVLAQAGGSIHISNVTVTGSLICGTILLHGIFEGMLQLFDIANNSICPGLYIHCGLPLGTHCSSGGIGKLAHVLVCQSCGLLFWKHCTVTYNHCFTFRVQGNLGQS